MSDQTRCQQLTRRGRPCRNPALPNSDPPRCARHQVVLNLAETVATQPYLFDLPAGQPTTSTPSATRPPARRTRPTPEAVQPYLLGFAPEELDQLESKGLSPDLNREVQTVRVVLLRLLQLWGDPTQATNPEEARRLAALIFSGARTVAHLLSRPTKAAGTADWLARALSEIGGKHGIDL